MSCLRTQLNYRGDMQAILLTLVGFPEDVSDELCHVAQTPR